jgi:hypothetical protein
MSHRAALFLAGLSFAEISNFIAVPWCRRLLIAVLQEGELP